MEKLYTVREGRIVDRAGRNMLLHGFNAVHKQPEDGYLAPMEAADWDAMARAGVNCVRLGIFWDALEPMPGEIDFSYLARVAERADAYDAHGIAVFLDMHQDLYARMYSDGAPDWAVVGGEGGFAPTEPWSDAYLTQPAVQDAIDSFWANAPAPDGMGLRDHFREVWRQVARYFADRPHVIGYDLYNEPIPGRMAGEIAGEIGGAAAAWAVEHAGSAEILQSGRVLEYVLSHIGTEAYFALTAGVGTGSQMFERQVLQPFYDDLVRVIRAEDPSALIFFCPGYFTNLGIPTALEPLGGWEHPDPLQVFAPHGYDLVVDTDMACYSQERVNGIFAVHAAAARRMGVPMVAGEWGAFYGAESAPARVRDTERFLRGIGAGSMYWSYVSGVTDPAPHGER